MGAAADSTSRITLPPSFVERALLAAVRGEGVERERQDDPDELDPRADAEDGKEVLPVPPRCAAEREGRGDHGGEEHDRVREEHGERERPEESARERRVGRRIPALAPQLEPGRDQPADRHDRRHEADQGREDGGLSVEEQRDDRERDGDRRRDVEDQKRPRETEAPRPRRGRGRRRDGLRRSARGGRGVGRAPRGRELGAQSLRLGAEPGRLGLERADPFLDVRGVGHAPSLRGARHDRDHAAARLSLNARTSRR
jgi:hypothetical protein